MFYSFDALNSRNGRFRLVWRAATATRKKLSKRECQEVSVWETCEELLQCIPSSHPSAKQAKTKYSLYLLAQLLYGTVIIHREQIDFFFLDVRHLWNKMRRPAHASSGIDLPLDKRQGPDVDGFSRGVTLPEAVPEGARRSARGRMRPQTLNDLNFVFDFSSESLGSSIVDFHQLDNGYFARADYQSAMGRSFGSELADISDQQEVRSVRREDITMNEPLPDMSRATVNEQGEELMPPTMEELEILQNMMDSRVDDFGFGDQQVVIGEPSFVDGPQPIEQEQPMDLQQKEPDRVETPSEPPTFELEAVPAEILEERAERRLAKKGRAARHRMVIDQDTFINKELMQSAIADYSDLVWTKEELMVDANLNKRPNIDELFGKRPVYIKYLAPPLAELVDDLLAPRPFERITAQEAWGQRGVLLHREGTPSSRLSDRQQEQPLAFFDDLQQPFIPPDDDDQLLLEAEPRSKRRRTSEPDRTPTPALINQMSPILPADRTPEVLERERAAEAGQRSVGSIDKGRPSSMLPPDSTIMADVDDVYVMPEGVLEPISERDTATDRLAINVSEQDAVRRFSKETLMPPSRYELSRDQFVREIQEATVDKANKTTTFAELTTDNDRAQAAKKFYLMLALLKSKHRKIAVKQTVNYGSILITSLV